VLRHVAGLVIERGGLLSHAAIIAREYGIPLVIGVPEATERITAGAMIEVDGDSGVVRTG
jgi:pyruvate,water dikinase